MRDTLSLFECESATLYAALVNPSIRKQLRSMFGSGGARFFECELFARIYAGLVENAPDIPLWDAETLDWLTRTEGRDLSESARLEVLRIFAGNTISSSAPYYAERVIEEGRKRLARDLGNEIIASEGKTPSEMLSMIEQATRAIAPSRMNAPVSIGELIGQVEAEIEAGGGVGIQTGFPHLDEMLGGLSAGNLMVIGAGTGRGKTALAVNMAVTFANAGVPVSFVALEMSAAEVARRIISINSGIVFRKDMTPLTKPSGLAKAYEDALRLPISVSAGQGFNIGGVEAGIEALKLRGNSPSVVIVDYLQLMEAKGIASNRQEQVAEVSRSLKRLAMRNEIPVIVLSQLRRLNDSEDADARPGLHHLRESGAIEQDADSVLLLSNEKNGRDRFERVVLADLAKNRHGPVGEFKLVFNLQTQAMVQA